MTISIIDHGHGASSDGNTFTYSPGKDFSAANLIVVGVSEYGLGPGAALSDNSGAGSWTKVLGPITSAGGNSISLYYKQGAGVGINNQAFTLTGSGIYPSIFVLGASGAAASPFDSQHATNTSDTTGTSFQPSSGSGITPSENNELVVAMCASQSSSTFTVDSPYTSNKEAVDTVGGVSFGGILCWNVQTTATQTNPTFSWTGSHERVALIGAFKAAALTITGADYYYGMQSGG